MAGSTSDARLRVFLGSRIRDRRLAAGLTLQQAADRAGVSLSFLSDCERGDRMPTLPKLVQIADGLGLLVTELLAGLYPFGSNEPPSTLPARQDGRNRANQPPRP